jgi:hypothetical protein
MNKVLQATTFAAILAFGMIAGTTIAQTDGAESAGDQATMDSGMMKEKHHGKGMGCRGMMDGDMKGHGKKGMHHGMKMDGKGMGCMGMKGMKHCKDKGCMQMMDKLSAEDRQDFMNQTRELRKEMMGKRFDYKEIMRNPASTTQEKEALEKEIETLHDKMMEKMKTFKKQ